LPLGGITALMAVYGLVYLVWERAGWGDEGLRQIIGTAGFMPLNLLTAALFLGASRKRALEQETRRALLLFSLGSVSVFLGNAINLGYIIALGEAPLASWADAFYLSDSALMLAGLMSLPMAGRVRWERYKFAIDAGMVLVGGAVAIWFFNVRPTWATPGSGLIVSILAFAYPLASLLVMLGATTVLMRGRPDANVLAFRLLVGGTLISIVADLAFNMVLLEAMERSAAWVDGVYLLFYLIFTASGELFLRAPEAGPKQPVADRSRLQQTSPLPYLAICSTYGLLLLAALTPWSDPYSGIAVAAVVMTVLVVARQVLAVRQNVRLLAETAAQQNEARFRSLVQNSSDVILVVRPDGRISFVSPAAIRILRLAPEQLTGRPLLDLVEPEDRGRARDFLQKVQATPGVSPPIEWRIRQPDGSALDVESIATNLAHDPTVLGLVLNTRDITERKRLERELTHQAFHDSLTGLANRPLFRNRVGHALTLARRQHQPVSVLFLDLDDFKKVNDSLGHAEGDRLLVAAADRFRQCARAGDTVARLGGDEFAVLLEDGLSSEGVTALVDRLQHAMSRPFQLSGNAVHVNVSVGVATGIGEETADDLLRNADMAMYTAKRRGKGRCETYQAHMYADVKDRLAKEEALRAAIEQRELFLVYQPVYNLATGEVAGVEALVRWEHPEFGALLPQHFVPLAEESGLIISLGQWVLHEACRQMAAWRAKGVRVPLSVGVNVSGRQLHELDIVAEVREALSGSGVAPDQLVLEITESVLMQHTDVVLERLTALRGLGVRLAIDDFGTGYSSLSYLQRFPIDIIKVARPFVEDLASGVDRAALARAIIGLGDTLKLRTVAEGVETAEQCAALRAFDCGYGQGYYFAPPLTPVEVERLLQEPRRVLPAPVTPPPGHVTPAA
jgi:diguanylate cyclase (GGDEF)-like protein/PAS domain S-box-containing protein